MTPTPMLDAEAVDATTEDEEEEREEVVEEEDVAAAAKKIGVATSPLYPKKRKELTPRC